MQVIAIISVDSICVGLTATYSFQTDFAQPRALNWIQVVHMLDGKTLFIAGFAFIVPLTVVAVMNREMISETYHEQMTPDPTVGKVMYFYSPG